MNDILLLVITNLCTGSLSWLFTLKFTRKEAEANAMSKVQEVYQKLIKDLQDDRENLKKIIEDIKKGREADNKALNERIDQLVAQVERNERLIKAVKPLVCAHAPGCRNFQIKDITEL